VNVVSFMLLFDNNCNIFILIPGEYGASLGPEWIKKSHFIDNLSEDIKQKAGRLNVSTNNHITH
jgi:ABC-type hemin transport system ATPase subunit